MPGNEVSDYKQLKALKKKIAEDPKKKLLLKALFLCGSKVPVINSSARVALMANKKQARFVGVSSCKSSWGCPVCTAREMAKYAAKIACAIDALKERSLAAAMLTFTIPHTAGFTCEQVTEILYNTWKAFTIHGNYTKGSCVNDIFSKFCGFFQSKHRVRVAEYTWGKNGWHPHFHCLFWFPKNRLDEILEWEDALNKGWLNFAKRYSILEFLKDYPEIQKKPVRAFVIRKINSYKEFEDAPTIRGQLFKVKHLGNVEEISDEFIEVLASTLYRFWRMYSNLNLVSKAVYISKKEVNAEEQCSDSSPCKKEKPRYRVIVQESANYLTGWGGDLEVTHNCKNVASHSGHYTWQQILSLAIEGDKMKLNELNPADGSRKKEVGVDAAKEPDWWQLYFEYMMATRKQRHARINFSVQSGIGKIIADWKKTHVYKTFLKKNRTEIRENFGVWKTVCFFTVAQWKSICNNDLEPRILELATANDAKKLIAELLELHQIPPPIENEAEAVKLEEIWNAA